MRPLLPCLLLAAATPSAAANVAAELEAPSVEVVGTTPLAGVGTPLSQVPVNVQVQTGAQFAARAAPQLADHLQRLAAGVGVNEAQGNPWQPDLSFRGFTASPLLGTPQGLSVFQDGVRINESLGDVVNWDLLPPAAISSVQLLPGSNPVFGLNTLGGALSIQTKSGFQHPGVHALAGVGSYGRRQLAAESGGADADHDAFIAVDRVADDGWREHSATSLKRLFAKVGAQTETDDFDLSLTAADNRMEGVQSLPLSMLDRPRQGYTWPDVSANQLLFLNAKASRVADEAHVLAANLFYRDLSVRSLSSNLNDTCLPACATNDALRVDQARLGGGLQYSALGPLGGRANRLAVGLALEAGRAGFVGDQQDANLTADRGTAAVSAFRQTASVGLRHAYAHLYATDTLSPTAALHLTASLSYSRAAIAIADRSGAAPALDGSHRYARWNPAVGVAYAPQRAQTWFADLSQGMRAPTPMELTCADPNAPCRLPNVFLADPPLKPVVSRTLEAGARLGAGDLRFSFAAFRSELADDIAFVGSGAGAVNAGYFQGIGKTRRQGIEAGVDAQRGALDVGVRASLVDATYRSATTLHSPNNSSADAAGDIRVAPGDRLPGIPRRSLKLFADWAVTARTRLSADLAAYSAQYARGDENNRDAAGALPGYVVANLNAEHRVDNHWRVSAALANIFGRAYANFGVLGRNFFTGPGDSFDAAGARAEQFRTPGAPRTLWVALQYSLEKERRTP